MQYACKHVSTLCDPNGSRPVHMLPSLILDNWVCINIIYRRWIYVA